MEATPPREPLRPLGLGEMLDRAVTLCVRFFVPLALVESCSAVAGYAYDAYTGADPTKFWTSVATDIQAHAVISAHVPGGTNAFSLFMFFVIDPLVGGALIELIGALYLGRPTTLREACRMAGTRAVPLATITAIFFVGSLVIVVAIALVMTLGILIASAFASLDGILRSLALAVAVLLSISAMLAFVIIGAAFRLAWSFAPIVCVLETANPARAIAETSRRLFAKARLRRTLPFAAANLAISLGSFALVNAVVVAFPYVFSRVGANVFQTLSGAAASMLGTAFCCIFYYDLRVRDEGYDLQFAALKVQLEAASLRVR